MLSLLTFVTVVIFGAVGARQTGSLLRINPHSRNHAESRHFQQPQLHRFGAKHRAHFSAENFPPMLAKRAEACTEAVLGTRVITGVQEWGTAAPEEKKKG